MSEAPPRNFLGLPAEVADPKRAAVHILPVPYEATTSYLGGARNGPQAILDASRAVELYDHELDDEPYLVGVATLPELHLTVAGPGAAMRELRRAYARVADSGKFVVMLGGEHSISGPPILEHAARLRKKGRKLSVLQLDAHGDLRDAWEGTPFSHACVMRRVADHVNLVQVGIRAIDASERRLMRRRKDTITTVFAEEVASGEQWIDRVLAALGKDVYLTIDVDYFDPSLVPSTGTPEPGGGTWYPTMRLLERVFQEKRVVAADVVELAPIPGMSAPDFLVAKLVYRLIGYYGRYGRRGRKR
ncbi:MAG: agmatinase [Gemmatimonadales bacterium]|nr:agmatinase [Gemmatimonadales bacterium]